MTTRTSPSQSTASGCVGRASSLISVKRLPVELYEPGIPLSTPEQTFIDLAAIGVNLVDLVVLGDAMLKAELTTIPTLPGSRCGRHG